MKRRDYQTISGRTLEVRGLGAKERNFLASVQRKYKQGPEWSDFAAWWSAKFRRAGLPEDSLAYRICEDLEARLGIAQGKVARPDYRDYLSDLIEERYGSRYRFCRETGVDPGHLSRVFASRSELSLQNLERILEALQASLVIQPRERLAEDLSPERALEALVASER
jgi:transcriptional regulator with XRE-family HTH domain